MPEIIGDYQYSKRDLIGHGAFAIVFLGHSRIVRFHIHLNFSHLIFSPYQQRRIPNSKSQ